MFPKGVHLICPFKHLNISASLLEILNINQRMFPKRVHLISPFKHLNISTLYLRVLLEIKTFKHNTWGPMHIDANPHIQHIRAWSALFHIFCIRMPIPIIYHLFHLNWGSRGRIAYIHYTFTTNKWYQSASHLITDLLPRKYKSKCVSINFDMLQNFLHIVKNFNAI